MNSANGLAEDVRATDKNPFPGLRPFQAEEAHLFFGRERYIDTVIDKLTQHHFVSIVGNSGSGKSSLLRAGVLPKLLAQQQWIVVTMRPGKNPVEELNHTIAAVSELKVQSDLFTSLKVLQQSELGLVQLLRNAIPPNKKILLVVDQFEELFRFNKEHEEIAFQFVNLLLSGIQQQDVPINVIITLRSDFIGDCEQFIGLPEAINNGQFLIPRMKREELQLSITGPIEYAGQRISPRLVQQLIKDVGSNPDQLPILQHVLMRTWDVWLKGNDENIPIDLIHYEQTGKMEKALSNHAEEAMLEIETEQQRAIVAILFKTLTVKESDNRGVRRPTGLGKIAEIANTSVAELTKIVNIFRSSERGFLMPPANVPLTETSMVDISHESLMRVWERLAKWVEEEYASAQIYQRITASAILYEKGLSGLWRDPDLQIALDWDQTNKVTKQWSEQYNQQYELSKRFVEASLQQKNFLIAERRRKRRLSNMLVLGALVVLSGLSIWAVSERNRSESNEQLALTEKQNAQMQEAIATQQKLKAQENAHKAESEKLNAEKQRKIAMSNELEANKQKQNAIHASFIADNERKHAESEKQLAIQQRARADSLRKIATVSEKNAYRLRMLSISQTLATKSAAIQKGTYDDNVKLLLALQAYQFNKTHNGKKFDQDLYSALYAADKYDHNGKAPQNNSHTDMVRSVVYSPNDKEIASAGSDGVLIISDANAVEQNIKVFPKQNAILDNVSYHSSGEKIACVADKTAILVFDRNEPAGLVKEIKGIHMDMITALGWCNDQIVSIGFDNQLKISDPQSQKVITTIPLGAKPSCLVLRPQVSVAYIGFEDGTIGEVLLKDNGSMKVIKKVNTKVTAISVAANSSMMAIGTNDGKIQVFGLSSNAVYNLNQHSSTVTGLSFNEDGKKLISSSLDGLVYLWDMNQPDVKPIVFKEHDSWVWSVSFNNNGTRFCSGGKDKNIITYVATEEELVNTLERKVKRNLTQAEWSQFVGTDIPFEQTVKTIK